MLATGLSAAALLAGNATAKTPFQLEDVNDGYVFIFNTSVTPGQAKGLANRMVSRAGGQMGHTHEEQAI